MASSRIWNRRGKSGGDSNASTPRNLQDLQDLPDEHSETVVKSFWSHAATTTGAQQQEEEKQEPERREGLARSMSSVFFSPANTRTPERNTSEQATSSQVQQETAVASFWSHKASSDGQQQEDQKEEPDRRGGIARTVSSAFFSPRSRSPSPTPLSRTNSSDGAVKAGLRRWGSRKPATEEKQAIAIVELQEENSCLKQQVKILQETLQEREKERTEESLLCLEEDIVASRSSDSEDSGESPSPRRLRWSQEPSSLEISTAEAAEDAARQEASREQAEKVKAEQTPAEVQRAIEMSMELAESRAQVDTLRNQLQQAEHTIRILKEQLTLATDEEENNKGKPSQSQRKFREWLGRSGPEEVLPADPSPKQARNDSTHSSGSNSTAELSATYSSDSSEGLETTVEATS